MKKRAQLVCQHLENISREALEKHQDIIRQYARGRQGIYALYRKNKLYYVGLATNLRNRLKHHLKDRHGHSWDRFSVYLTIGDHHLRELEALTLRITKPSGNKQKGKFAKSEDLRRRFRRDIKQSVMAEVEGLFSESSVRPHRSKIKSPERDGRQPILKDYISGPMDLRARFKGKIVKAHVRRDGTVSFLGKLYTSPSLAAAAACHRPTCNGWIFWQYERAPGDWVKLDILRKK
jgi:predicted GIY-YIG superfamily endonuclease